MGFDLGIPELIIILVIVVILFGPGRLSKIAGELGKGIKSFRENMSSEQQSAEEEKNNNTQL
jgi:sec-independent protein translocase protein TatA